MILVQTFLNKDTGTFKKGNQKGEKAQTNSKKMVLQQAILRPLQGLPDSDSDVVDIVTDRHYLQELLPCRACQSLRLYLREQGVEIHCIRW